MVTKPADQVDVSVSMLDKIEIALHSLRDKRDGLQQEIYQIEHLGWVEATPYYRDGKYLYLIHPMVNGERQREYIGGDPEKIQDALDRITRKDEYERLGKQLAEVESSLYRVQQLLLQAYGAAYAVKW